MADDEGMLESTALTEDMSDDNISSGKSLNGFDSNSLSSTVSSLKNLYKSPSSHSKRRLHEDNNIVDDFVGQICSKMDALQLKGNPKGMIEVFVSVLVDCDYESAQFFLESSDWNIEAAVHLYLEYGNEQFKRIRNNSYGSRFIEKEVPINDLPPDWSCWVNAGSGLLYFLHKPSGHTQSEVPPGYADNESYNSGAHIRPIFYDNQEGDQDTKLKSVHENPSHSVNGNEPSFGSYSNNDIQMNEEHT